MTKKGLTKNLYPTAQFRPWLLAEYCFIAQPATLIRRHAWENVGGLDETLNMAFDYDLWWWLYNIWGPLLYVKKFVAVNRRYAATKTSMKRKEHYKERGRNNLNKDASRLQGIFVRSSTSKSSK